MARHEVRDLRCVGCLVGLGTVILHMLFLNHDLQILMEAAFAMLGNVATSRLPPVLDSPDLYLARWERLDKGSRPVV